MSTVEVNPFVIGRLYPLGTCYLNAVKEDLIGFLAGAWSSSYGCVCNDMNHRGMIQGIVRDSGLKCAYLILREYTPDL